MAEPARAPKGTTWATISFLLILLSPWCQSVSLGDGMFVSRLKFPYGTCADMYTTKTQTAVGRVCVQRGEENHLSAEENLVVEVHLYNDECVVTRFDVMEELSSFRIFGTHSQYQRRMKQKKEKELKNDSNYWSFPVAKLEDLVCDFEESFVVLRGEVKRSCLQLMQHDKKADEEHEEVDVLTFYFPVSCASTQTTQTLEKKQKQLGSKSIQEKPEEGEIVKDESEESGFSSQASKKKTSPCEHFVLHTPKTGGTSLKIMLRRLLKKLFANESSSKEMEQGTEDPPEVQRSKFYHIPNRRKDLHNKKYRKILFRPDCLLLMGERAYDDIITPAPPLKQHSYAMVREANSHVLSQYFHCKESGPGKKHHQNMVLPSLGEWLKTWTELNQNGTSPQPQRQWDCYNPINLQSYLLHSSTKEDLQSKFDVVGITPHIFTTACLIVTKVLGEVPEECDCTSVKKEDKSKRKWTGVNVSHGVEHHGDTFEPNQLQKEMLHELTDVDRVLYDAAVDLFEAQVKEMEARYKVRLCGQ